MTDDRIQLQHKPGEKVRINCPDHEMHGREGIVRTPCMPYTSPRYDGQISAHLIEIDGRCTDDEGISLLFAPYELEMIESEDQQKVGWDDCLWAPPREET